MMFDKYKINQDMGDVVIRAFDHGQLVVTTVDYHDLEIQLRQRSITVSDQREFIEQNIKAVLGVLWSKYASGKGEMQQKQGSQFVRVKLTEADIARLLQGYQEHLKANPTGSAEILRAKPIEGEVDYAELGREHIARYPKIRAALAK